MKNSEDKKELTSKQLIFGLLFGLFILLAVWGFLHIYRIVFIPIGEGFLPLLILGLFLMWCGYKVLFSNGLEWMYKEGLWKNDGYFFNIFVGKDTIRHLDYIRSAGVFIAGIFMLGAFLFVFWFEFIR